MFIVRNHDGGLRIFKTKPQRKGKDIYWNVYHADYGYFVDYETACKFTNLKDTDEPREIEINLK